MIKSYSAENQDLTALVLFNSKRGGTYLEIGSGPPIDCGNNTYLLEKEFDWRGVSLDIYNYTDQYKEVRKNPFLCCDATSTDINLIVKNLGGYVDFLQIDVDGTNQAKNNVSLRVLESIDFNVCRFGFVTFEHNLYLGDSMERQASRDILLSSGYTMFISDVCHNDLAFEDWYIKEEFMPNSNWKSIQGHGINLRQWPTNFQNLLQDL